MSWVTMPFLAVGGFYENKLKGLLCLLGIVASLLAGFAIYLFRSFGPEMERTARLVRCAGR